MVDTINDTSRNDAAERDRVRELVRSP